MILLIIRVRCKNLSHANLHDSLSVELKNNPYQLYFVQCRRKIFRTPRTRRRALDTAHAKSFWSLCSLLIRLAINWLTWGSPIRLTLCALLRLASYRCRKAMFQIGLHFIFRTKCNRNVTLEHFYHTTLNF